MVVTCAWVHQLMMGTIMKWPLKQSRAPVGFPALQTLSDGAIKQKQKFERLVVSKENLLKMFEVMRQGISNPLCSSPL